MPVSANSGRLASLGRFSQIGKTTRRGLPLWLEIVLVLLIKLTALFILWKAFFSHPQTKHMALPTPAVEQHLLSPESATLATPAIPMLGPASGQPYLHAPDRTIGSGEAGQLNTLKERS
jgi:hypothetical protein